MTNPLSSKKRLFRYLVYAFIPLFYISIFYDKNDRRKKVKNIIKRAIINIGNRAYCQSFVNVEWPMTVFFVISGTSLYIFQVNTLYLFFMSFMSLKENINKKNIKVILRWKNSRFFNDTWTCHHLSCVIRHGARMPARASAFPPLLSGAGTRKRSRFRLSGNHAKYCLIQSLIWPGSA